jgi:hypothetical protein
MIVSWMQARMAPTKRFFVNPKRNHVEIAMATTTSEAAIAICSIDR